ncbi:helix-turn-helix transcriptional regulator [Phycicoccus sp. M110.8]|uniref:helix-turn-helix domain-containing protein n=1 Tax=Phycicoccus sp. M110.8 TaxID=3075433 RepID=UPI0028FD7C5F|nr:helix-turn-helix transcriptional regulator [Phycicoccus sp. M110.8]MDU0312590.1 helix-turn-helix transcriptional regulator [Phycicoccus sp. M110.8]
MDPDDLAAEISRQVRLTRARRVLSQRELARQAGVSKSLVGRLEAAELPASVHAWLAALPGLGVTLTVGAGPDDAERAGPDDAEGAGPDGTECTGTEGAERTGPRDAVVTELDAYRDLAGRRFPAHRRVEPFQLTTYWWSRHADRPLSAPNPPARWSGRRATVDTAPHDERQPPSAAPTTSRASACTCARCSGPRNDSA